MPDTLVQRDLDAEGVVTLLANDLEEGPFSGEWAFTAIARWLMRGQSYRLPHSKSGTAFCGVVGNRRRRISGVEDESERR